MEVHNRKSLKEIRRNLRQESTLAEDFLWQHIRNRNLNQLKFKRQHSIGNYVVDFYCASKRLIIEVDGVVHGLADQLEKDKSRDENLIEMDFKILRFSNEEVLLNINFVKQEITKHSQTI
ncbi:MAG: endonuclease domain-containing protein [Bacteroidetes bacterium]|nr:endonuclease domain-containing protein [Bacteroidota bacterium]